MNLGHQRLVKACFARIDELANARDREFIRDMNSKPNDYKLSPKQFGYLNAVGNKIPNLDLTGRGK